MRKTLSIAPMILLAMFVACSSNNKQTENTPAKPQQQEQPKAAEYATGRSAFQKMFVSARSFAADVQPYRLESVYTDDAPAQEGKAGIWRAAFASPSRRAIKAYTWSGLSGPDMPERGVTHGTEDQYNPSNASTQIFDIVRLKVDSDKAFETAQKHGGEKLTKKDPKQPVVYVLDYDPKDYKLIWHVIYGRESRGESKLRVAVDASTGQYLRVEH